MNMDVSLNKLSKSDITFKKILSENLNVDYGIIFPKPVADTLFQELQNSVEYLDAELTKVNVFGKWHCIPRQQVAYGDRGLTYKFSGVTVSAKPWIPPLETIKSFLERLTGYNYNFVLINRYRNGSDHIGEHRDDEKEMDKKTPIASVSLGQQRTFVFRHTNSRKKSSVSQYITPVKLELAHGSVLLMNPPTNEFWYHSLPPRKTAPGIRINLTFRKIIS